MNSETLGVRSEEFFKWKIETEWGFPLSLWERVEFHCERLASNRNSGEGFT